MLPVCQKCLQAMDWVHVLLVCQAMLTSYGLGTCVTGMSSNVYKLWTWYMCYRYVKQCLQAMDWIHVLPVCQAMITSYRLDTCVTGMSSNDYKLWTWYMCYRYVKQ